MAVDVIMDAVAEELKNFADKARGPVQEGHAGMINRHEQYWRFCDRDTCMKPGHVKRRGFIVIGPSLKSVKGAFDHESFRNSKHATPLPQYGQYEVGYQLHQQWSEQNPFGRFTPIVTQPGGLAEFPREQIIDLNWHKNPIVLNARPDVADVPDLPCPFGCRGRFFTSEDAKKQHIEASHERQMVSTALGEQISQPMARISELIEAQQANSNGGNIAAIVAAVLQAMGQAPAAPVADEVVSAEEPESVIPLIDKQDLGKRLPGRPPRLP
jgi:hypothetical protein